MADHLELIEGYVELDEVLALEEHLSAMGWGGRYHIQQDGEWYHLEPYVADAYESKFAWVIEEHHRKALMVFLQDRLCYLLCKQAAKQANSLQKLDRELHWVPEADEPWLRMPWEYKDIEKCSFDEYVKQAREWLSAFYEKQHRYQIKDDVYYIYTVDKDRFCGPCPNHDELDLLGDIERWKPENGSHSWDHLYGWD